MNLYDLIISDNEHIALNDVFLNEDNKKNIVQLIKEHHYIEELNKYNLPVNNKVLLYGDSGCGKTTTAKAIANSLSRSVIILNLSNVVSARIGETAQHLKMIFEKAARDKTVLFLDEFDQIGKMRGNDDKDVGEMRRLVNTLIQLIDYYPEKALLICATNHAGIIDTALLRRFQLKIYFEKPVAEVLDVYYDKILSAFPAELKNVKRKYDISYAEARDHAFTAVKSALIASLESVKHVAES